MEKGPVGLFPKKGQERPIAQNEIDSAISVIRSLAARTMRGETKAAPLELYEAIQGLMPQPAVEVIVTDGKGRYALMRRPADEKHFGANKLHILGGFLKPDRKGISMVDAGRSMVQKEMGADDAEYLAGPIAAYQWKRGIEHPTGWPHSQVYVLKVGDIPEREDIMWLENDKLPATDEVITGGPGQIHLDFLRVYQEWCKDPKQPCVDLNEKPLKSSAPDL